MSSANAAPKGLQDVVANESSICFIDGANGILSYRGIDIHELAQKSTFEEITYLLWNGALPTAADLATFQHHLAAARVLPDDVLSFLRTLPDKRVTYGSIADCGLASLHLRRRRALRFTRSKHAQVLSTYFANRDARR